MRITKNILNIFNNTRVLIGIVVFLLVLLSVISFFPNTLSPFSSKQEVYSVKIIKISGCEECFDLKLVSSVLGNIDNIDIKEEREIDYSSLEAKKLIDEYNIKRVPSLIISSKKIDKINLDENLFRKTKNTAIFDKPVPYVDLSSGQVSGLVDLKEVYDPDCKECTNLSNIKISLEGIGIKIDSYNKVDSLSQEGNDLINRNKITYLPTLLVSKNINEYWWIFDKIEGYFTEDEDYYKFSGLLYPYKEISTGNIKGKVNAIYVINKTCEDCLNSTEIKTLFQRGGVYIDNEQSIDVNEIKGKNLLIQYNITKIPTVIFSKEILDYKSIKKDLENIGTFENDGSYVFRSLDILKGKYQTI